MCIAAPLGYPAFSRHGRFDPIAAILERSIRRFHKARRRYSIEEFPLHLIKKSSDCSFPCVCGPTRPPYLPLTSRKYTKFETLQGCRFYCPWKRICRAHLFMSTDTPNHAHFKRSGSPQQQRKKVKSHSRLTVKAIDAVKLPTHASTTQQNR